MVEGAAGIGKTRLLEALREGAATDGLETLAARGGELERDLPFGVVRQLFELRLHRAESTELASLVEGPAAVSTAVLLDGEERDASDFTAAGDRAYALLHGLYWLTSNLAEQGPLLLVVDDAQWADAASLSFLHYLARRVEDLPLLLVVALRLPLAEPTAETMARLRADPLASVLRLAPLSPTAVAEWVRAGLGPEAAPEFCDACHTATAGNPFLVGELIAELGADGIPPTALEAPNVAQLVPDAVARHVLARLGRLPAEAALLARAVALLGSDVALPVAGEVAELDAQTAATAADALVDAELLQPGPPLEFVHPLIRETIYADLAPGERTLAHARAAELLHRSGAPRERIATQLLAAPPVDERWAAETLRTAGEAALARGSPESAASYLRRALEEPLEPRLRADLAFELAQAEAPLKGPAATTSLTEALRLAHGPERRAAISVLLARRLFFEGRPDEAQTVCEQALTELGDSDADLRAGLESQLLLEVMFQPSMASVTAELTLRALRSPGGSSFGHKALLASGAWVAALAGLPATTLTPLAERALEGGDLAAGDNGGPTFQCAALVLAAADSPRAPEICRTGLKTAQQADDGLAVITNKAFGSRMRLFRGEIVEAIADAGEAFGAGEGYLSEIGPQWLSAFLAEALLERGELDAAQLALERANPPEEIPDNGHWHLFLNARATLLVAQEDLRQGLEETLECGRRFQALGGRNPAWIPWRSRAAMCLTRLGEDPDRARALAEEELELAGRFGAPRAIGRALRVHGLVQGGDAGDESLRGAVDVLEPSPARLELAHAYFALGADMRRRGRRRAAREPLRNAADLAHSCGAIALQERAHQELYASGARPRRRPVGGIDALTPSERRVAAMAADGLSNREIAQSLFVSLKTVEMHLGRTYRKLDLASRTQLPDVLAAGETTRSDTASPVG